MVGTSDTSQGIFDIRLRRRSSDAGRLPVAFGNTPHYILQVLYDHSLSLVSCSSSGWATSGRSHGVVHCDCGRQTVTLSSSGRASSDSCILQSEFLGADSRNLLRVFANGGDDGTMYAVASTPTPSYSQSGGHFQLIATNSNKMRVVHTATFCCQRSWSPSRSRA
jgi:hypothetical protein